MMGEIRIVFAGATLAVFMVFVATISAGAQTTGDGSTASGAAASTQVSQGTFTGASQSQLDAVQQDVAEEEQLPDYSLVVDDTSERRFGATGWRKGASDALAHGGSYATSVAGAGDARFKLKVPTSGEYALYAWWPSKTTNATASRFGVMTSSGTKWTTVDQSKDGGYWVEVGTYDMEAGDYYAVRIADGDGSGAAVADAVALVRGVASAPPNDLAPADGGAVDDGVSLDTGDVTYSASRLSGRVTGRQLIHFGRKHMGTPYYLSPPAPCWAYAKEDCSCFSSLVFRHFGKSMPDSPVTQFQYGHKVRSRSNLRRGDLVFWKENGYGNPITHVGMYAGHGYVLHASGYYGEVVESEMKYITDYYGARRIRPRL
jgi:cell wall-associated NlpC family hydrolase